MKATPYTPLAQADCNDVKTAVSRCRGINKPALNSCITGVCARILTYRNSLSLMGYTGLTMSSSTSDRYYDLYDSKAISVTAIKKAVKEQFKDEQLCPYCLIDTHTCLDHYFPRSIFPEFSISAQNLVPSCFSCNTTHKKNKWGSGTDRPFIHPYFDDLPQNVQYLHCQVQASIGILKVDFSVRAYANIAVTRIISSHFREMGLRKRYIAMATSLEIPKMRRVMQLHQNSQGRSQRLQEFVSDQITAYGLNTWQNSFYQAMAGVIGQAIGVLT